MFDLRNMPYTTGRIISWFDELAPVATSRLKEFIKVQHDNSVCLHWKCFSIAPRNYCFEDERSPEPWCILWKTKRLLIFARPHVTNFMHIILEESPTGRTSGASRAIKGFVTNFEDPRHIHTIAGFWILSI